MYVPILFATLEVTCPPVPEVDNAMANTTIVLHGTYVQYQCYSGHWFPDKHTREVIVCDNRGNWGAIAYQCERKDIWISLYQFKPSYN